MKFQGSLPLEPDHSTQTAHSLVQLLFLLYFCAFEDFRQIESISSQRQVASAELVYRTSCQFQPSVRPISDNVVMFNKQLTG